MRCSRLLVAAMVVTIGVPALAQTRRESTEFTIALNVNERRCSINVPSLDMGNINPSAEEVRGEVQVFVACPEGAPYTVGLDFGQNNPPNGVGIRRLANTAGTVFMSYEILKPNAERRWGSVDSGEGINGVGFGIGPTINNLPFVGRVVVYPTRLGPTSGIVVGPLTAAGRFSDTVVATVQF